MLVVQSLIPIIEEWIVFSESNLIFGARVKSKDGFFKGIIIGKSYNDPNYFDILWGDTNCEGGFIYNRSLMENGRNVITWIQAKQDNIFIGLKVKDKNKLSSMIGIILKYNNNDDTVTVVFENRERKKLHYSQLLIENKNTSNYYKETDNTKLLNIC